MAGKTYEIISYLPEIGALKLIEVESEIVGPQELTYHVFSDHIYNNIEFMEGFQELLEIDEVITKIKVLSIRPTLNDLMLEYEYEFSCEFK